MYIVRTAKTIVVFIIAFLIYHIAFGCNVFPVDENNVLQAPDWYPIVGIALSSLAAYFAAKKKTPNHTHQNDAPFVTIEVNPWIKSFGLSANRVVRGRYKGQGLMKIGGAVYITLPMLKFIVLDRSTVQRFSILCRKPNTSPVFIRSGKYQVEVFYREGGSSVLEVNYKLCEVLIYSLPNTPAKHYEKRQQGKTDIETSEPITIYPEKVTIPTSVGPARIWPVSQECLGEAHPPMPSIGPASSTGESPFPQIDDPMFFSALECVFDIGVPSVSMIQRRLNLSYVYAARLVDKMEEYGIIGPFNGSKSRTVLVTREQCIELLTRVSQTEAEQEQQQKTNVDVRRAVKDEENWRREQMGLSPIAYEFQKIDGMEGHQFEHWCAVLLQKIGFVNVEVTQGSGDQGVDVLAEKDGIKYAIQCKCYSSDLGNKPIQEVNTGKAIYHCQIGAVITNRYFTQGGKEAAKATGVLLWDRDWIQEKLKEIEK